MELRTYQTETHSHHHDFAQLVLPLLGFMEIEIEHKSMTIDSDTGVYIAPSQHHCFSGSAQNIFLVVDFNAKNTFSNRNKNNHSKKFDLSESAKKFTQFLHQHFINNERDYFSDSLLNELLLHFTTKSFFLEFDHLIVKAKNWIDLYYLEPVNLKKLAEHCHLSVSQLQRRFKIHVGSSIAEYWRLKKLQQAKLLFLKGFSIETSALQVGYENLSAFSRRFSSVFGESPSQWRDKTLSAKKMREMVN